MKVFLGQTSSRRYLKVMRELGVGRIWSDGRPRPQANEEWIFDNGAFAAWRGGSSFPRKQFLKRLAGSPDTSNPYFAVLPDKVGAGVESLAFSLKWLGEVKAKRPHWCWYLAVQDGMEYDAVGSVLDAGGIGGLFLGGTTRFKATAPTWCDLAHLYGMGFHYGRAATMTRLQYARHIGAESADTTQPLWADSKFYPFIRMLQHGDQQEELWRDYSSDAA
jgi:hypothetical protein